MHEGIGGYFELELPDYGGFLHDDGVLLNSGMNPWAYGHRMMKFPKKSFHELWDKELRSK